MAYIRKTFPSNDNKFFFSKTNLFYPDYSPPKLKGNCTWYAFGAFSETLGKAAQLCTANAENWYKRDYNKSGPLVYQRGQSPRLGAVAVWKQGVIGSAIDGGGHVAYVKEIKKDGTIITGNSGYNNNFYYERELKPPYKISGYEFQGFIYNPAVTEVPIIDPVNPDKYTLVGTIKLGSKANSVSELQKRLNELGYTDNKNKKLAIDRSFGPKTKEAVIKLQKAKNIKNSTTNDPTKQYNGSVGKNTAEIGLGWNWKVK